MTRALHSVLTDQADCDVSLAQERIQVAHELHDGVIQALVGINLQLAALQRSPADVERLQRGLLATQDVIRDCIADLRELIVRIRPVSVDAAQLPSVIAALADTFEHDTGIQTRCLYTGTTRASSEVCGQILRIAQEALMNVRRHSRATHVVMSLICDAAHIRLIVDDDGCGFPFAGRWTTEDLDRSRRGPAVMKERVRLLAGSLTIDSNPGHGARVNVVVPCERDAQKQ